MQLVCKCLFKKPLAKEERLYLSSSRTACNTDRLEPSVPVMEKVLPSAMALSMKPYNKTSPKNFFTTLMTYLLKE